MFKLKSALSDQEVDFLAGKTVLLLISRQNQYFLTCTVLRLINFLLKVRNFSKGH
jgi:hypothetical protein